MRGNSMARGMATSSWGRQGAEVLVDVSECKSQAPGWYTAHLKMPAMAVAVRGGVTIMAGQGMASWQIREYERWRL
jgi:hypothetical protein